MAEFAEPTIFTVSGAKKQAKEGLEKGANKIVAKGVEKVVAQGFVDEAFRGIKLKRRVTIKLHNETKKRWTRGSLYFECGTSDDILPERIDPNTDITFCARKTNLSAFITGVVGVIGYQLEKGVTLAIYFRVPYNKIRRPNKWNVMLVEEEKATEETFKKLSKSENEPIDGDMCWVTNRDIKIAKTTSILESDRYKFSGSMSSSAKSMLEVHITEETIPEDNASNKSS